jgi:putative heme-binding domain-containing protein
MRCIMFGLLLGVVGLGACGVALGQESPAADLVLKGGLIYDGGAGPARAGDVAIKNGRILAVGRFDGTAPLVVNCQGLCVAPGFIDLHNHSDQQIIDPLTRANVNFLLQGCTTIVTGNCGAGPIAVGRYLEKIDAAGAGTNVAHLLPHGALRNEVIGAIDRPATSEEILSMRHLADQAMQEGAFGLSTGLIYVPGTYASTEELVALAQVVARRRGIYASHIRNEGQELLAAVREALEIGRRAGLPVHISHFKSSGREAWGLVRRAAQMIEEARAMGQVVTADQYPYVASSTSLEATVIPAWARSGGEKELLRRFDDPEQATRIHEYVEDQLARLDGGDRILIARYEPRPEWVGRSLATIAREENRPARDIVLEISRQGGAAVVNFSMSEDDVRFAMALPWVATASDGRAYLPGPDKPHPRSYGTFSRKLGFYALREGVITLEQAIQSATGLPAQILGLPDRGRIEPGYWADLAVFDPRSLADAAEFREPHRFARGMRYVFVNGAIAVWQGTPTGALAGKALRHAPALTSAALAEGQRWIPVRNVVRSAIERGQVPGAVVLLARDGKLELLEAFGEASPGRPMQTDAVFRMASMSKPITSATVMMLVEEGKVRLEDPLSRFIPEFERIQVLDPANGLQPPRRPVTIHDLLTHTSGIPYGFNAGQALRERFDAAEIADGLGPRDPLLAENALRLARLPLAHHPGASWTYGMNTDLLGRVVEVASGRPFDQFLSARLLGPLRMVDTGFHAGAAPDRLVSIYTPGAQGGPPLVKVADDPATAGLVTFSSGRALSQPRYLSGGAGLVSTAADYARFLQMLLNLGQLDGVRLLKPGTVKQMTTNQIGQLDSAYRIHGDKFGLGFGVSTNGEGRKALPGGAPGQSAASAGSYSWGGIYHTFFWVDPRERLVAVVLSQIYPWGGSTLWEDFQKAVYQGLAQAASAEAAPKGASAQPKDQTRRMSRAQQDAFRRAAMNGAGNPAKGRELFGSETLKCANCHKVHGRGGDAGPDLSAVAGKLDRTHLIESLVDPSAQILEGYRATVVELADGRVLQGIVTAETARGFTLIDAQNNKMFISATEVEQRAASSVSLMPEDLLAGISPEDFTHVVSYLETLGQDARPTPGQGVAGAVTVPEGFVVDQLAFGLDGCTALEAAPDGRLFVCEQTGALRVIKNGQLLEEPFMRLPVAATWERGLIGVTVDPAFPRVPHVFVCYVAAQPYPHHVISRFTARGDQAVPGSEVILLEGDDQSKLGGSKPDGHQGGALHFGVDGMLYAAIGDQTASAPAQQLDSLLGKLLRIRPDGSIPEDNPFAGSPAVSGKYRSIWALGLRNPFTFAVQPVTGRIFINDVGGASEEVNEGQPGANYGWPLAEHGPTSDPRFRGPVHHYPTACISGGAFAPVAGPWAKSHAGRYFFADFNHGVVRELDPDRREASSTFARGVRRPVDLRFGADQVLYVLSRDAWVIDEQFAREKGSLLAIRPAAR